MRAIILIALIFAGLQMEACKKSTGGTSNTNNTPAKTKTDHLINGKWKYYKHYYGATSGGVLYDITQNDKACVKDNYYYFYNTKGYFFSEGANICLGAEKDNSGTWALNGAENEITLTYLGKSSKYLVRLLDDTALDFSTMETVSGVEFEDKVRYKH